MNKNTWKILICRRLFIGKYLVNTLYIYIFIYLPGRELLWLDLYDLCPKYNNGNVLNGIAIV